MSGDVEASTPDHGRLAKAADTGPEQVHGAGTPDRGPMRALMRRTDGGAGASPSPSIHRYRRCPCSRLFPVLAIAGRPPLFCHWHRNNRDRWRLRYGPARRRIAA